jgi:beta-ketodecanoyl-[acyl-carrier-protein] synthase
MAVEAAKVALKNANKTPEEIDCVIVSCSVFQRAYPAIATEVQNYLGTKGFAFDMSIACSSGIFGISNASNFIKSGQANCALVITPEINTAHINFRDRETHFIFGDAASAVVIEKKETAKSQNPFEILGIKLTTSFSNNIRNNFGYLNRCEDDENSLDKLCIQKGRRVFKEVVPIAVSLIQDHLKDQKISKESIKRFWLHQANGPMNQLILRYLLGRESTLEEAPLILDQYANTSSSGVFIAFNKYQDGFQTGDLGLISAFGAGYSAGSMILKKL